VLYVVKEVKKVEVAKVSKEKVVTFHNISVLIYGNAIFNGIYDDIFKLISDHQLYELIM
jgi:hypothetical protein